MSDQFPLGATRSQLEFKILNPDERDEIKAAYAEIHRLFLEQLAAEQKLEKRLRDLFGKVNNNEAVAFSDQGEKGAVLYRYEVYASKELKSDHNRKADGHQSKEQP